MTAKIWGCQHVVATREQRSYVNHQSADDSREEEQRRREKRVGQAKQLHNKRLIQSRYSCTLINTNQTSSNPQSAPNPTILKPNLKPAST